MLRKDFLAKVEQVAPALMASDLIPILNHIWITGKELRAFNDQIGLSVPFKADFKLAIPGALLISLLKSSKARDIELVPSGNELLLKLASSKVKLPTLGPESFTFEMPKPTGKGSISAKSISPMIGSCLRSVNVDPMVVDQLGITLIQDGKETMFCSTNEATLSFCRSKLVEGFSKRVILSSGFCRQLVDIVGHTKGAKCEVTDDYALLTSDEGISCFGHLIAVEKPMDYQQVIEHDTPANLGKMAYPIPSKLRLIIERALVIAGSTAQRSLTKITTSNGVMRFVTKSDLGEVVDTMQIGEGQKESSISVDAKFLKIGFAEFYDQEIEKCGQMLLTDSCVIMVKGQDHYLIAKTSG
jgi:DNA polymerase III sliding clamp (beta) subunit (PCNA family)